MKLMALSDHLRSKLRKKYQPSSLVEMKYKGNDLSFQTDDEGNPVLLFIGKKNREGNIRGERYRRTLKKNSEGVLIKDHWDLKGKAT
jgi:hypothetical protein